MPKRHSIGFSDPPPTATDDEPMVVLDAAMMKTYEFVRRAARTDLSVLIWGETGVGKGALARMVHDQSPRWRGPFNVFKCTIAAEEQIEPLLFGYDTGASRSTGAVRDGLVEASVGGTLFLDELGDLPRTVQGKLLCAIEHGRAVRLGETLPRRRDVRIVAATNRDLRRLVRDGDFRSDLYYRISGVAVQVPALRHRALEIAPLATSFARKFCANDGRPEPSFGPSALACLQRYHWPGNLRELKSVVEQAVAAAGCEEIEAHHLHLMRAS